MTKFIINIFTGYYYINGRWIPLLEAHASKETVPNEVSFKRKTRIGGRKHNKRQKKSHHTDYRMKCLWTEDDVHATEIGILSHIGKWEKKHHRVARLDDVLELFKRIQLEETEPHTGQVDPPGKYEEKVANFLKEIYDKQLVPDHIINFLESLFATVCLFPRCVNLMEMVCLLMLFIKSTMNPSESFCSMLRTYLVDTFLNVFEEEDEARDIGIDVDARDAHSGIGEGIILLDNWRMGIRNPIFEKLSFAVSFLVTAGFLQEGTFSVGAFKVFKREAFREHVNFTDIIDGVFSTVIFFLEKGWQCFATRSLKPLWSATSELNEFDDDLAFLLSNISNVRNGNLFRITGVTDSKFQHKLEKCRERVKLLIDGAANSTIRSIMIQKRIMIEKINADFFNYVSCAGLRESPFTMCIYGKSSVGKSTLCTCVTTTILQANDFDFLDEFQCTIQDDDKFWSTYRSQVTGLIFDDMCNTKADKALVNPAANIIKVVNNIPMYANMAEADRKGKTFVMPKVCTITTNNTSLDAAYWSVEPVSVLRRLHVRIICRVRPEYASYGMLDTNKIRNNYPVDRADELVKDVWYLTPQYLRPIPAPENSDYPDTYEWATFEQHGKKLEKISIYELIRFLVPFSKIHFASQADLVDNYTNFGLKSGFCKVCYGFGVHCTCPKVTEEDVKNAAVCAPCASVMNATGEDEPTEQVSAHSFMSFPVLDFVVERTTYFAADILYKAGSVIGSSFLQAIFPSRGEWKVIRKYTNVMLYAKAERLSYTPFVWWTRWVPDRWVHSYAFRSFYWWISRHNYYKDVRNSWVVFQFATLSAVYYFSKGDRISAMKNTGKIFLPFGIFNLSVSSAWAHARIVGELKRRRLATDFYKTVAQSSVPMSRVLRGAMAAGTTLSVFLLLRGIYSMMQGQHAQSQLDPVEDEEVKKRNAQVNPWKWFATPPPVASDKNATSTPQQLIASISRTNLVYLSYSRTGDENTYGTDGLYIQSNILMMPYHIWFENNDVRNEPADRMIFDIVRAKENSNGGWKAKNIPIYFVSGKRIGNEDLMVFPVPSGGVRPSIVERLPLQTVTKETQVACCHRKRNGELTTFSGCYIPGDADYVNSYGSLVKIQGGRVTYSIDTFKGMCMSILVSHTKPPVLLAVHIAGKTGTCYGNAVALTQSTVRGACEQLAARPGHVEAHSTGTLPMEVLGKPIGFTGVINPKSPIQFLEYYNATVYGSCNGGAKYISKVVPSLISQRLIAEHGFVQKWGPPQFRPNGEVWRPWFDTLQHLVIPRNDIDPLLLEKARVDYLTGIIPKMQLQSLRMHIKPLTLDQNINGVPGVRFLDGLKLSTSIGFPLSGAKSKYIVKMYPTPDEMGNIHREFLPALNVQKEIQKCEDEYNEGRRCHHIFKACLKDEPTDVTKTKVRVFEAAPILLQLLIRKYFLPVIRFLSMVPLVSECAVGLNCYGDEWSSLHEFITEFGDDTILAGDYSKWDLRLPAILVLAAFDILIKIAQLSGNYTQAQLRIMRGIATDVAYPVVAYNGTLVELHGSNPSGQNLTAHLNSICNSLLLRMAYFSITKETRAFRQMVHAMTYGDDLISGVDASLPSFNHISVRDFLAHIDIEFTMPDKVSEPTPYMHISNVDFLKRKSVYNKEMGRFVGALQLSSIDKSLMNQRKDAKDSDKNVMRSIVQSALHELVLHGEEVYTRYANILWHTCVAEGVVVPEARITYAHRIAMWIYKYDLSASLGSLREDIREHLENIQELRNSPVVGSMPDNVSLISEEF